MACGGRATQCEPAGHDAWAGGGAWKLAWRLRAAPGGSLVPAARGHTRVLLSTAAARPCGRRAGAPDITPRSANPQGAKRSSHQAKRLGRLCRMRRYVTSRSDLPRNGCQHAAGSMPDVCCNNGSDMGCRRAVPASSLARRLPSLVHRGSCKRRDRRVDGVRASRRTAPHLFR